MRTTSKFSALCAFILVVLITFGMLTACVPAGGSTDKVTLDITEKTLFVGEAFSLTATANNSDKALIWSSDDETAATVENGLVTAVGLGDAIIKVKCGTAKDTCFVTVIAKPEAISLDCEEKTLTVGETFKLTAATATPDVEVVWASGNKSVATVVNGTVKAIGAGSTVITASYGNVSAGCSVSVVKKPEPVPEPSVKLDITQMTLTVGEASSITATVTPSGNSVVWSSSNQSVATVLNGKVTAVAEGSAVITAKCGTAAASCTVTVEKKADEGEVYTLVFGDKSTTCSNPGVWYFMCDGSDGNVYSFASPPVYDNGTVTLAFNWVSTDTSKHFQLRTQPDFEVGTEYTVKFTAKLSAEGRVAYGLSNNNTTVAFASNESKQITCKSTVTAGEPLIIEVLPTVRNAPITLTVSDVVFSKEAAVPEPTTLKDKYADYFPVGAAVTPNSFNNFSALMGNFNSVTPENDMKWKYLEPSKGVYSWTNADKIIDWAKQNGAGVRGHCLLWYKSLPSWLKAEITDKASALGYIDGHIEEVMTHFGTGNAKDVIYAWDVCNEVLRNTVSATQLKNGDIWRTASEVSGADDVDWYAICGTDFIKRAFAKADEMRTRLNLDKVGLYYNDYNLNDPNKRAACVQLVQMLQADGIAIDGVGMQAHYRLSAYDGKENSFLNNFEASIKAFTELGIDVQITELDIRLYANDAEPEKTITAELLEKQAEMYGKIFEICRRYATPWKTGSGRVTGVTTWGVADTANNPWNTAAHKEYPLIFDINKLPKKAFDEIMDF